MKAFVLLALLSRGDAERCGLEINHMFDSECYYDEVINRTVQYTNYTFKGGNGEKYTVVEQITTSKLNTSCQYYHACRPNTCLATGPQTDCSNKTSSEPKHCGDWVAPAEGAPGAKLDPQPDQR